MLRATLTMQDVADDLGISKSTVSRALNHHPRISQKTIERVTARAKELDYQVHPYLRTLMTQKTGRKLDQHGGVIAYLNDYPDPSCFKQRPLAEKIYQSVCENAQSRGWRVEYHPLTEGGIKPHRLKQILESRGILGLILGRTLDLSIEVPDTFKSFALVTDGFYWQNPGLDRVRGSGIEMILQIFQYLHQAKCKRVGVWVPEKLKANNRPFNHLLKYLSVWDHMKCIHSPPEIKTQTEFLQWVIDKKLDGLFFHQREKRQWVVDLHQDPTQSVTLAEFNAPPEPIPWTGIHTPTDQIGYTLVDVLIKKITHGDFGFSMYPRSIVFSGLMNEGSSALPCDPQSRFLTSV